MSKQCVACGKSIHTENLSFFSLPKNTARRNEWLTAIGRETLIPKLMKEQFRKMYRICEMHFERRQILIPVTKRQKYLSCVAYPTLNLQKNIGSNVVQTVSISQDEILTSISQASRAAQTELRPYGTEADYGTKTDSSNKNISGKSLALLVKWREQFEASNGTEGFFLFTLSLFKTNPQIYNFLKNALSLPSPITLRKYVLPHAVALDQRVINVLRLKANEMTAQEKICCISIDCIPAKQALFYDITNDKIIGFSEINDTQNMNLANCAVVVMARGMIYDWQQPIAHCFLANPQYVNNSEVVDWVEEILTMFIAVGFDVRAIVTDQSSNIMPANVKNPDGSYLKVTKHEICRLFDAPRLIQSLKEHIQTYRFMYKHNTVLTSDYLEDKVNNLDKILNYKEPRRRYAINAAHDDELQQLEHNFLKYMLDLFKYMRLVNIRKAADVTPTTDFIIGFQVTIESVLLLHETFKSEGLNLKVTSRLNLEGIDNIVKRIKKKNNCEKPTCNQISRAFKKHFVTCIMEGVDHDQEDLELLVQRFQEYPNANVPLAPNCISLAVGTTDYRFNLPEKQVIRYIARYLYKKCYDIHSHCFQMKQYQLQSKSILNSRKKKDLSKSSNITNWSQVIPDFFIDYIFLLEKKCQDYFIAGKINNVGNDVLKTIGYVIPNTPCGCFPFDYASKLFIRLRIYHTIKMNNASIKSKKGVETMFKAYNLNHL